MQPMQEAFIKALTYAALPMQAAQDAYTLPERQAIARNDQSIAQNQQRQMDLGRITVSKQLPPTIPVQQPQVQQPVQQQPNKLWEVLKAIAPQLISAGVGMAVPGALPGAAGFSKGYSDSQEAQILAQAKTAEEEAKFKRDKELKSMEGGTKPTWAQEQKMQMIKDALKRKKVSIAREFGEPLDFPLTTEEEAVRAIQNLGFDPTMFSKELADSYGLKQANFVRPDFVKQEDWDKATDSQKQQFMDLLSGK
jgi:hypothetical protein